MNILLLAASLVLPIAMVADGLTSVELFKAGSHETDLLMVKIYGTNRPSAKRVYLTGLIALVVELGVAWAIGVHHPVAADVLGCLGLGQAVAHTYCAVHNFKLL